MGWGEEELARYAERRKGTRAVFVNSDEDCWVVEWVACRPEHRGKGYINTLLHDILNKGKEKGYKQVCYLLPCPSQHALIVSHQ